MNKCSDQRGEQGLPIVRWSMHYQWFLCYLGLLLTSSRALYAP